MDDKLDVIWHCTLAAQKVNSMRRSRKVSTPLPCSGEAAPGTLCPDLGPETPGHDASASSRESPEEATKIIGGLEHLS